MKRTPFFTVIIACSLALGASLARADNRALLISSFDPLKPNVRTYWDASSFYVEGDSMPSATLMPTPMVGITSWQQQLPITVGYFGNVANTEPLTGSLGYGQPNVWQIPMTPVPASSSIPLLGNFLRGAIAIAANGIPIFNPRNNTGQFSQAIGELDQYGGHCGRADDYHYHIAPTHLTAVLGNDKPIAWALDGYPIYGYLEPDGSAQLALDADGGHDHGSWGYHYHARGTAAAGPQSPYLMSAMHGNVVNFGGQIDPQPTVGAIAPAGSPLAGAVITGFTRPAKDQYVLTYTLGGTTYSVAWQEDRNAHTVAVQAGSPSGTTTGTYTSAARFNYYPMAGPSMLKLPDTGQTISTTDTFGEDSDYTRNAPSLTDNGNGTITDNVTGLMWQKVDSGEMTWENAMTGASGLTLGGYSDWRMPTAQEAFCILNQDLNPALNSTYFVNNSSGTFAYFWTSDLFYGDNTKVWVTNAGGGLGPHPKTSTISAGGTSRCHARYVRGALPTIGHNYYNNLNGTITDLDTGLMWKQEPSSAMSWASALTYAEGLSFAGYSDWRVPNVKELQSLVDISRATASATTTAPCINRTLFPAATATAHWTSTSVKAGSPTAAWLVDFGVTTSSTPPRNQQGIVSYEPYTSSYPVFAVRTVTTSVAAPTITNTQTSPNTPTYADSVWVTAQLTAAPGATISTAQLSYSDGTQITSTIFAETMANSATVGTAGWDGTGAVFPWSITSSGGDTKQTIAANHGTGNACGLEFGRGSASPTTTMATTTNPINATGSVGTIQFWAATSNLVAGLGWNFQLSTDGTTWTTRLSEVAGSNHVHQIYTYTLQASERVSTLRMRFQFIGNGTGGPTGPKVQFDDITVVTTSDAPSTQVMMFDDGLHGDGIAGDGVLGAQIPLQTAGKTITYSLSVTDSNGSTTTSAAAASYIVSAVTPPTNFAATATRSGDVVIIQWPTQAGISYSVQTSENLINWVNIPVGQVGTWTDSGTILTTSKRFYRVMR